MARRLPTGKGSVCGRVRGPVITHPFLLEGEDLLPVVFHADDGPAFGGGFIESLVELADGRFTVVGVFALGVGVVDDEHEVGAGACCGPLQHLLVAVGVAKCSDRAAADVLVDADGFAGAVVDEAYFGQAPEIGFAIDHLELSLDGASDDLLGWNSVGLFRPGAHEFDSSARDDVGLEAIGPQIGEELNHGLIDALVVRLVVLRICGGAEPVGDDFAEPFYGHSAMGRHNEFHNAFLSGGHYGFHVAFENTLEGLRCLPLRMAGGELLDAVESEGELNVHGLLNPKGAIVIEGGYAFFNGNKVGRPFLGDFFDEGDDGFLGGRVVPRRQRIRLRVGEGDGNDEQEEGSKMNTNSPSDHSSLLRLRGWCYLSCLQHSMRLRGPM